MDNKPPKRTLRDEINKRQAEQRAKELEAKRTSRTMKAVQPSTPAKPASPVPEAPPAQPSKRTTQTTPVTESPARRIPLRIFVMSGLIVMLACVGIALLVTNNGSGNGTGTPAALPIVSAQEAIDYLKKAGVPVAELQTIAAPNQTWKAQQEIQFSVQRGNDKGSFIILSYNGAGPASQDTFRATTSKEYSTWHIFLISNLLVISPPDSAQPINAEIANHLTQFLAAPYISFLPTTTLQLPSNTPRPASITPTASRTPFVTQADMTYVTVTPTPNVTATIWTPSPIPTTTLTPSRTIDPADIPTRAVIVTIPTQPTATAIPPDGATPTPRSPESQTLLPPPSVTAAGTLILAGEDVANKFVSAAPTSVGPFALQKFSSSTTQFGATLLYTTLQGDQLTVSLFITDSAQDALDKYQAEVSTLQNAQAVSVCDAAVIAQPGSSIVAECQYRNVVLVVYRGTAPGGGGIISFTSAQVEDLLKALFAAIPQ